jgi:hypothetical protein
MNPFSHQGMCYNKYMFNLESFKLMTSLFVSSFLSIYSGEWRVCVSVYVSVCVCVCVV